MGSFKFIDKTADIRLHVEGRSFEDLIKTSALAFTRVMCRDRIKCIKERKVSFESSEEKVVFKFLEELLFLLDTEQFLVSRVKDVLVTYTDGIFSVEAVLCGDSALNYDVSSVVKAVTYNDFIFRRNEKGFVVEITLDL